MEDFDFRVKHINAMIYVLIDPSPASSLFSKFIDSIAKSTKTNGISYYFREIFLVLNYFYLISRRKFGRFKKLNL